MSAIEPVRRNPASHAGPAANWDKPAPPDHDQEIETVDPVQGVDRAELSCDRRELTFDMDPESDRLILQVIDENTKAVIFQSPADHIVRLARERRRASKFWK